MEFDNLIALVEAVSRSELTDFRYEEDGLKLRFSKHHGKQGKAVLLQDSIHTETVDIVKEKKPEQSVEGGAEEETEKSGKIVRSPLVGVFYAAMSEDAQPFVAVGDHVEKGQILAIIEAMKLMNEIESDYDGIVEEIFVENGQPVEYGQPLFCLK